MNQDRENHVRNGHVWARVPKAWWPSKLKGLESSCTCPQDDPDDAHDQDGGLRVPNGTFLLT